MDGTTRTQGARPCSPACPPLLPCSPACPCLPAPACPYLPAPACLPLPACPCPPVTCCYSPTKLRLTILPLTPPHPTSLHPQPSLHFSACSSSGLHDYDPDYELAEGRAGGQAGRQAGRHETGGKAGGKRGAGQALVTCCKAVSGARGWMQFGTLPSGSPSSGSPASQQPHPAHHGCAQHDLQLAIVVQVGQGGRCRQGASNGDFFQRVLLMVGARVQSGQRIHTATHSRTAAQAGSNAHLSRRRP